MVLNEIYLGRSERSEQSWIEWNWSKLGFFQEIRPWSNNFFDREFVSIAVQVTYDLNKVQKATENREPKHLLLAHNAVKWNFYDQFRTHCASKMSQLQSWKWYKKDFIPVFFLFHNLLTLLVLVFTWSVTHLRAVFKLTEWRESLSLLFSLLNAHSVSWC